MPDARTYTATYATVQQAADSALNAPDGVDLLFKTSELGSMEACAIAARSFQTSFSALRARARRLSMQRLGEEHARDTRATGIYDKLICQRRPLAEKEGWVVSLIPSHVAMSTLNIIDRSTGLPLNMGRNADERTVLLDKALNRRKDFTAADWDRLTQLDIEQFGPTPELGLWHEMMQFPRPTSGSAALRVVIPPSEDDTWSDNPNLDENGFPLDEGV